MGKNMKVKIDCYGYLFVLYLGKDIKKFNKRILKEFKVVEDCSSYAGICYSGGKKSIILINRKEESVLIHELLHAVKAMCRSCGINDEEVECYTLDYLFDKFKKNIKHKKEK